MNDEGPVQLASHPKIEGSRRSLRLRNVYRGLKWAAIALIALSMAEFLAFEVAMLVAADVAFYMEMVVAGWLMSTLAFLHPAIGYRLTMLGSRMFHEPAKRAPDRSEDH